MTSLLQAEVERLADTRQPHALTVFDVLDEWFRRRDFDCGWAMDTLTGSAGQDATLERYAEQAGSSDPREAGQQLQILMIGAILSAERGDERAAMHARSLAQLLLDGSPR